MCNSFTTDRYIVRWVCLVITDFLHISHKILFYLESLFYNYSINWNLDNLYHQLGFRRLNKGQDVLDTIANTTTQVSLLNKYSFTLFPRVISLQYSLTIFLFKTFYFKLFLHFWKVFLILLTSCKDTHLHVISFFIKWFIFLKWCASTLQNN